MFNSIIADGITRIRNGYKAQSQEIELRFSKFMWAFLEILKEEGYIEDMEVFEEERKKTIGVKLKYLKNKAALKEIKTISKPGQKIYAKHNKIPVVANYFGCVILSTNRGLMTSHTARNQKIGGELLARIF